MENKFVTVFLAGAYRSKELGTYGIVKNLQFMSEINARLWNSKIIGLAPNLEMAMTDGLITDWDMILEMTIELALRCDFCVFLSNWKSSSGCLKEHNVIKYSGKKFIELSEYEPTDIEGQVNAIKTYATVNYNHLYPF
jgi:hypothetical protein